MGRHKFGKGTYSLYLIRLIYYVGELVHADLNLIRTDNINSLRVAEKRLCNEGYLVRVRKNNRWYTTRGQKVLKHVFGDGVDADYYYRESKRASYSGTKANARAARGRNIGRSAVFFSNANCIMYPDEKKEALGMGLLPPFYYLPHEIYHRNREKALPGFSSRAVGYLVTGRDLFSVFIPGREYSFQRIREAKSKAQVLSDFSRERNVLYTANKAICLIDKSAAVENLITRKTISQDIVTDIYSDVFMFPLNLEGEKLAEIFIRDAGALRHALMVEGVEVTTREADILTPDGVYVLQFFIPNLGRLGRFYQNPMSGPRADYVINCFDIQKDDLAFVEKHGIRIQSYPFEPFYEAWKKSYYAKRSW